MTEPSQSGELTQDGAPRANLAILGKALERACIELFRDYGLEARIQEESVLSDPPTCVYAGAVNFGGKEIRGRVLFCASEQVLLETARGAPGKHGQLSALSDWTCELANQLIGRVKNKLRDYNVSIEVSVPRLLARSTVNAAKPRIRYRFRCEAGSFSGLLEVLIAPGVVLAEHRSGQPLVWEGDLVFL